MKKKSHSNILLRLSGVLIMLCAFLFSNCSLHANKISSVDSLHTSAESSSRPVFFAMDGTVISNKNLITIQHSEKPEVKSFKNSIKKTKPLRKRKLHSSTATENKKIDNVFNNCITRWVFSEGGITRMSTLSSTSSNDSFKKILITVQVLKTNVNITDKTQDAISLLPKKLYSFLDYLNYSVRPPPIFIFRTTD